MSDTQDHALPPDAGIPCEGITRNVVVIVWGLPSNVPIAVRQQPLVRRTTSIRLIELVVS